MAMMATIGEILPDVMAGAAARLDKPGALLSDARWCRGMAAQGPDGKPRAAMDPEAIAWSAVGALERALIDRHYVTDTRIGWIPAWKVATRAIWTLFEVVSTRKIDAAVDVPDEAIQGVELWAARCTHDELLAGFDRALARRTELARHGALR
jgi:hypothetical protein